MCGIYGQWSEHDELLRLGAALAHRGPDDQGRFDQGPIHLGNRRLAIHDLGAHGRQPMVSADGALALTFNGEIYNHRELRRRLEARGHRFVTRTDSEVLLACFREWGDDAVHELAGMFAVALWKARERELLLIRDPTGVKPLFYAELDDGGLAFASELRALLELPGVRREIDAGALWEFLDFGYGWTADHTILSQVRKVAPGHAVRIRDGRVRSVDAWYRPPAATISIDDREGLDRKADELRDLLVQVVEEQLDADVPVGLLLSGGLDSSILAAICASVLKADVPTFTVGFAGVTQEDPRCARLVAGELGTTHRELELDGAAIVRELQTNAGCFDDLFWDPGLLASLALFRCCRAAGVVVTLVGEGADELFGGYNSFTQLAAPRDTPRSPLLRSYRLFRHHTGRAAGRSLEPALARLRQIGRRNGERWYETIRDFEMYAQMPNNVNARLDRASMASSVEARVPYQDPRVTALAQSIGGGGELGWSGKTLLKHMASRHRLLPESVIGRPKLGLLTPGAWIATDAALRGFAERTLLDEGQWARRLGLQPDVAAVFGPTPAPADLTLAWRLLILECWSRRLGLTDAPLS